MTAEQPPAQAICGDIFSRCFCAEPAGHDQQQIPHRCACAGSWRRGPDGTEEIVSFPLGVPTDDTFAVARSVVNTIRAIAEAVGDAGLLAACDPPPRRPGPDRWFWVAYADDESTAGQLAPCAWAMLQAQTLDDAPARAEAAGISRGRLTLVLELPAGFVPDPGYTGRLFTGAEAERIRTTNPPIYGTWAAATSPAGAR